MTEFDMFGVCVYFCLCSLLFGGGGEREGIGDDANHE